MKELFSYLPNNQKLLLADGKSYQIITLLEKDPNSIVTWKIGKTGRKLKTTLTTIECIKPTWNIIRFNLDNNKYFMTSLDTHVLIDSENYKLSKELKTGDKLLNIEGNYSIIKSIESVPLITENKIKTYCIGTNTSSDNFCLSCGIFIKGNIL